MQNKLSNFGKLGADALVVVMVTTLVLNLLRDNGVEISTVNTEMIIALVVVVAGRVGVWVRAKTKDKGDGTTGQ